MFEQVQLYRYGTACQLHAQSSQIPYREKMMLRAALFASAATVAFSHGMMNRPSPRNNRDNSDFSNLTGCAGEACYW
jgi:hypothetical protein